MDSKLDNYFTWMMEIEKNVTCKAFSITHLHTTVQQVSLSPLNYNFGYPNFSPIETLSPSRETNLPLRLEFWAFLRNFSSYEI